MPADRVALSSVRPVHSGQSDRAFLLRTVGQLWLAGVPLHWPALHGTGHRRRVPLPTYPFQRQRYWLEPRPDGAARPAAGGRRHDPSTWFCVPSWHRMPASPADADLTAGRQHISNQYEYVGSSWGGVMFGLESKDLMV